MGESGESTRQGENPSAANPKKHGYPEEERRGGGGEEGAGRKGGGEGGRGEQEEDRAKSLSHLPEITRSQKLLTPNPQAGLTWVPTGIYHHSGVPSSSWY